MTVDYDGRPVADKRLFDAQARCAKLEAALKPFADFADVRGALPNDYVITQGSSFAKQQLTMGDCNEARSVLKDEDDD